MMHMHNIAKIASGIGAFAFLFCVAAGANAAPPHPGGGGGGHPAFGGGGHPAFGGGGHPAFGGAHFAPHIGGGGVHFAPHVNFSRGRVSHFASHASRGLRTHAHISRFGRFHVRTGTLRSTHPSLTVQHAGPAGVTHATVARIRGTTDPHTFAAHRNLAGLHAFRPFLAARWHFHHHLGWVGPWFWPFAFGDFFYCGLWPYDYCYYDPFWYYGYADVYEGIFSPYDYQPYVEGPGAPARMTALTQTVAQSCTDEAAEVTGWPIDQIQAAVKPNAQQSALLDALGNAVVKASDVIRAHCPTSVAFTPPDRLAQMRERLEGLVQAVNIVQPPLAKFYDSLTDEQKARFNDIGAQAKRSAQERQAAQNPQGQCGENVMSFPTDKIDQIVHPNGAQRAKLDALVAANAKAADLIKASCPSELPATPPDRLAAEGEHVAAMLQAVQTIRPPLDAFYAALSDEQKAHFNNLGRQLFAQR